MPKNKRIINPNKITSVENKFLHEVKDEASNEKKINKYKGRMISMSDDFYSLLNEFLKNNPTEGNRSTFNVRLPTSHYPSF